MKKVRATLKLSKELVRTIADCCRDPNVTLVPTPDPLPGPMTSAEKLATWLEEHPGKTAADFADVSRRSYNAARACL
jgi:hypothetical protein